MLTDKEVKQFRDEIDTAKNPLFLFDDDPDGLCSFLLLYKMNREGRGMAVKSIPVVDTKFLRKVEEVHPDKIFILDMPIVEQEFIDKAKTPIFWLDHHPPLERNNITYFNPRVKDDSLYIPTSLMAYKISNNPEDLWIGMVGSLADYNLPDFTKEFLEKYPDLMENIKSIENRDEDKDQIIYHTLLGKLIRIFSFILKGKTSDMNKCIKILTRIKTPYEILNQETSQGKYIYRKFERINVKYEELIDRARKAEQKPNDSLFIFEYSELEMSFTSELGNELVHFNPDKIVIVAREKSGDMKCSFRSKDKNVQRLLEKALVGIEGYGGGHELACGGSINKNDWEQFLNNLRREILES